ncbi:hypothetical protein Ancab_015210 [Ancistrocladus abbreviatus]
MLINKADFQALGALKNELIDRRGVLRSWNGSRRGACLGDWIGINCTNGQVTAIQLPFKGLAGRITSKIGQLQGLRKLSLHDNLISGTIPSSLGFLPNLRGLYLFNNRLSGSVPHSIGYSPLQNLDLSNNFLTGVIPSSLVNSTRIYRLNLSFNLFYGSIPDSFSYSPSLAILDLQHNNLSGSIPDRWGKSGETNSSYQLHSLILDYNHLYGNIPSSLNKLGNLELLSVSHNRINGTIPDELGSLSKLKVLDLSSNSINGSFPVSLCNLSSLVTLNMEDNHLDSQLPNSFNSLWNLSVLNLSKNKLKGPLSSSIGNISGLTSLDLSENNLTGEIPASLASLSSLTFFNVSYNNLSGMVPSLLTKMFNSTSFLGNHELCGYSISTPCLSPMGPSPISAPASEGHHKNRKTSIKDVILILVGVLLVILLLLFCVLLCCLVRKRAGESRKHSAAGGEKAVRSGGAAAAAEGGKLVLFDGPIVFTAEDLLSATAEIMAKTAYGTVYKATLEDGSQVAVKRLKEKLAKSPKEFEIEAAALGCIRHPNLLALRAYYIGPKGEKLLVFDYMPKGSLSSFLHARSPETTIDWPTRMKIAIGITRGLHHLHTQESLIHGILTSSEVYIDDQNNPKIADYGISRLMTDTANTNVIATAGSTGYRAPELQKQKMATVKTDIYSLGIIILELLTGKPPSEAIDGVDLPEWVASTIKEEWTNEVFDLELMRDVSTTGDEMVSTLKLALHLVDPSPDARPDIKQVLQQLEEINPNLAATFAEDATGETHL